jgi:hypothetical protein
MQCVRSIMTSIASAALIQMYPSTPHAAPGVYYLTLYAIALSRLFAADVV